MKKKIQNKKEQIYLRILFYKCSLKRIDQFSYCKMSTVHVHINVVNLNLREIFNKCNTGWKGERGLTTGGHLHCT